MSKLKKTCFNIWKKNFERKGISPNFKPVFVRYIGVEDTREYNDILKTFHAKITENENRGVIFDGSIPMKAEFQLIDFVNKELKTMDVRHLSSDNIKLFQEPDINDIFIKALQYVVDKAIAQESFFNDNVRNNFIVTMIVWSYLYLSKLDFDKDLVPKCVYYGDIARNEMYFLMLMHMMSMDVIFINPLRNNHQWDEVDTDHLSTVENAPYTLAIQPFAEVIQNAQVIDYVESMTLQYENELEQSLFTGTGVFRPWQFKDGDARPLFMNTSVLDLKNNWNEPAKVRQGFKVEGKNVVVPTLFHKVDGEYNDSGEYYTLVHTCTDSKNTLFCRVTDLRYLAYNKPNTTDVLKISFCQRGDGSFDIEKLKKLSFYKYAKYRDEMEDFVLRKINEVVTKNRLFRNPLNKEEILDFIAIGLSMDDKIMRLIDNFDYTADIPKIAIFLERENVIEDEDMKLVALLSALCFDVVIFSPSGLEGSNVINPNRFNNVRLDSMSYDRTYQSLKPPKKGIFKLFGKG